MRIFIDTKNQNKLKNIKEATGKSAQFTVNAIINDFFSSGDPADKMIELLKKNLKKYKLKI